MFYLFSFYICRLKMVDTEKFICEFCVGDDKPKYSLSDLTRHHQLAHRDRVEESCEYCEYIGANYKDIILHYNSEHSDKEPSALKRNNHNHHHNYKPYLGKRKRKRGKVRNKNVNEEEPEDGTLCTAFNGSCTYSR